MLFYPGFVQYYNGSDDNAPALISSVFINTTEVVINSTSVIRTVTTNKTVVVTNSSGTSVYRETKTEINGGKTNTGILTETTGKKITISVPLLRALKNRKSKKCQIYFH